MRGIGSSNDEYLFDRDAFEPQIKLPVRVVTGTTRNFVIRSKHVLNCWNRRLRMNSGILTIGFRHVGDAFGADVLPYPDTYLCNIEY